MRPITLILVTVALVAIAACLGNTSYAQVSATAQVAATIVTPLTIEKLNDLEFERFIDRKAKKSGAGRTGKGRKINAVTAATVSTTMKPASFNVTGYPDYTYGISVPATVTVSDGSHEFTLDDIVASGSFNQILSANGKGTVSISGKPFFRAADPSTADADVEADPDEPRGLPVTIMYN